MMQTLTIEKLKALSPCDDKYLDMFGEHKSMNIEQAFDAGFTVSNICWLMGALGKRKEIIEFANFCAKQAADDAADAWAAADEAANAADDAVWVDVHADAAHAAVRAADASYWTVVRAARAGDTSIRKEQKQFLMELLK